MKARIVTAPGVAVVAAVTATLVALLGEGLIGGWLCERFSALATESIAGRERCSPAAANLRHGRATVDAVALAGLVIVTASRTLYDAPSRALFL